MKNAVDEYIEAQREEIRPVLREVRNVIHEVLPEAQEVISWQMPAWRMKTNLIHFAAQKKHLGLYPGAEAVEHFSAKLKEQGYKYSKGTVQFPCDRVSLELIREIAAYVKPEE